MLTQLENAIKRDFLSSNFETTFELLNLANQSACNDTSSPEMVSVLPWVPQTTAAVALRLMDLDRSISYLLHQEVWSQKNKTDRYLLVSILTWCIYSLSVQIVLLNTKESITCLISENQTSYGKG